MSSTNVLPKSRESMRDRVNDVLAGFQAFILSMLFVGLPAFGIGYRLGGFAARAPQPPAEAREPAPPLRTGYWHNEPHRMTLSHYVDYMLFLPPKATEARQLLRAMCYPLIPKGFVHTVPDFVRVDQDEYFPFLEAIPNHSSGDHANRMFLSCATGAPERFTIAQWEEEFAPHLARLPEDLAFLRTLPRREADHVYVESPEVMWAINRAVTYMKQEVPEPLPTPHPVRQ